MRELYFQCNGGLFALEDFEVAVKLKLGIRDLA